MTWDAAPCGLLTLRSDGTVVDANPTLLEWVGRDRADVVDTLRLSQLLSVGGRIYWETHLSPLLHVDGRIDEVALELRTPTGRTPVLMTAVLETVAPTAPVTGLDAPPTHELVHVVLSSARERSRYERELLAARRQAELSAKRSQMLLRATTALSQSTDLASVVRALLSAATGPLGASSATVWVPDAEDGLVPRASAGEETQDAPRPSPDCDLGSRVAVDDGDRVVVPLHGLSTLQGVLSLAPWRDPGAEDMDREALSAVGQQAGLALDRAQLYEHSASVSHQLQQSLLASQVPVDDRFVVTTLYRPGVDSLEVGGDWFDAFLADDDVLAVGVGDVVGKGLRAATVMGQLRSAVRAVAGPGVGPARLLSRLDRFAEQVPAATSATLAHVELDLTTARLQYACAGHMPPVVLPALGPARLLWDGRSTPLGLRIPGRDRLEADLVLEPGDQVLLYTDGLVERRSRPLPDGFLALVDAVARLRGSTPEHLVRALTADMLQDEEARDDVCLLLLTWVGPHGR